MADVPTASAVTNAAGQSRRIPSSVAFVTLTLRLGLALPILGQQAAHVVRLLESSCAPQLQFSRSQPGPRFDGNSTPIELRLNLGDALNCY